jgi:response regulator RpfG family c-di-GMP phosphodiesterase
MSTEHPLESCILLVDDEEGILNSLRRLLRNQPYHLLLATSAAQAL